MNDEISFRSVFRILDAALNRASEGLRVLEDCARMHLNDGFLSKQLKAARHDLIDCLRDVQREGWIVERDTQGDVGTNIGTKAEYTREGFDDIARANFARVQQALRSIEEHVKVFGGGYSQPIEQIRYKSYTLEKVFLAALGRDENLFPRGTIYVLIDSRGSLKNLEQLVKQVIAGGAGWIQFRDKRLNDRELIEAGVLLTQLTRETPTRWIMNDRADLAVTCGADGVHVGQDDLTCRQARKIVGPKSIVGVTTHCLEEAKQAELDGADYIGVGPVFPSATKAFEEFAPAEFIESVISELSVPALAIGGINTENVQELMSMGIRRVAVSQCVVASENPAAAVESLRRTLLEADGHPAGATVSKEGA